jgi:hypothetical protein
LRPGPFRKEDTISIDRAVATAANPTTVLRGDKESKGGLPHDQLFVITGTGERAIVEVDRLATDDAARLIVRANNELEDTRRGEILKWDRVARKLLSINRPRELVVRGVGVSRPRAGGRRGGCSRLLGFASSSGGQVPTTTFSTHRASIRLDRRGNIG